DAAAGVHLAVDHQRRRVDVEAGEVPPLDTRDPVQAVKPVVAGANVDGAVREERSRFGVAAGLKMPEFLAAAGVETVDLAVAVLMKALADVDLAVRHDRRGEDRLHLLAGVE